MGKLYHSNYHFNLFWQGYNILRKTYVLHENRTNDAGSFSLDLRSFLLHDPSSMLFETKIFKSRG